MPSEADVPDVLWDTCFPPPLEGRWWYRILETCGVGDGVTFAYAVIEENGRPAGVAPLFSMRVPLSIAVAPALRRPVRLLEIALPPLFSPRTLFVGSPCADEGTVGLLPGVERRRAFAALQDSLEAQARRERAAVIVWKDLPATYDSDMRWLAERNGLFRMVSYPAAVIEFGGPAKSDYFAGLKSSRRNKLKKKLRHSAERADLVAEVVQAPGAAVIDEFFALFVQTYRRAKVKFERLDRRFFEVAATHPHAHFLLLRQRSSGTLVAGMLCFAIGARIINKFIGMDYRRPRDWFLYFRLWEALVDWALARGAHSIQSGQTGYEAKIEIGHRLIPLTNYGKHRGRIAHWLYCRIAGRLDWASLDADLADFVKAHPELDASHA